MLALFLDLVLVLAQAAAITVIASVALILAAVVLIVGGSIRMVKCDE